MKMVCPKCKSNNVVDVDSKIYDLLCENCAHVWNSKTQDIIILYESSEVCIRLRKIYNCGIHVCITPFSVCTFFGVSDGAYYCKFNNRKVYENDELIIPNELCPLKSNSIYFVSEGEMAIVPIFAVGSCWSGLSASAFETSWSLK